MHSQTKADLIVNLIQTYSFCVSENYKAKYFYLEYIFIFKFTLLLDAPILMIS